MAADAGSIKAGGAYVSLGAKDSELNKVLKAAEARVKAFGQSVAAIGAGLAAAGTAITAPILAMVQSFSEAGSALNDMSERTGVSVEGLSRLGFAAQLAGSDLGAVEGGIKKMQRAITEARLGSGEAQAVFAELGLSLERLVRLSPDRQFEAIAKAIARIPDPTARAAATMQVFGRAGTALLPMIGDMEALTRQAEELGLVMSTADAHAADALGDAMDTLKLTIKSVWYAVGATLAPALTDLLGLLTNAVKDVREWVNANRPLVVAALQAGAALVGVGTALTVVGGLITAAGVAVTALLNPITLTVAALGGLAAWFLTSTQAGGKALAWLGERFQELKDQAVEVLGAIGDALAAGQWQLAAEIGWAAIKVVFVKGWNFLKETGGAWVLSAVDTFQHWRYATLGIAADVWAGIQVGFLDAVDALSAGWTYLMEIFRGGFRGAYDFILKLLGDLGRNFVKILRTAFTGGDVEGLLREIVSGAAAAFEAGGKEAAEVAGDARSRYRLKTRGDVEAERKANRAAIDEAEAREKEARRRAFEAFTAGDAEALDKAMEELQALEAEAADARLGAAGAGGKGKGFSPEEIGAGVEAAAAKVSVRGGFSAQALRGLGAGESVADDQLKESRGQTALLRDIKKNTSESATFGN